MEEGKKSVVRGSKWIAKMERPPYAD